MISLLLSIFMFLSIPASTFNLREGTELLRTNVLSTIMLGGVLYISIVSTSLFYREMSSKSILSVLVKPVSISAYYFGKFLGIFQALFLFFLIMASVGLMSTIVGTPDTATTTLNFLPLYFLGLALLLLSLLSAAMNYMTGTHLVSFLFIGWGISCPILFLLVMWLSPTFSMPLPGQDQVYEFVKAGLMIFMMLLIIGSFSIALSSFTGPVLNLFLCIAFLLLGLMSPGLMETLRGSGYPTLAKASSILPNLHLFWMADMINIEKSIPLTYMVNCFFYALVLILSFSTLGLYTLLKKDYS